MQKYDIKYWAEDYVKRIEDLQLDTELSMRTLGLLEHFEEYFNENVDNPS
jgi:hypothetical protein